VLLQKDPDAQRSIASLTKLMTALLTLERARPESVFTAPAYDALAAESRINLRRGERMTVADLLEALMLESANDAAVTLAGGVSGSRAAFVRAMNVRARDLGLRDTSYANPIGLDSPGNYSTARDVARLAGRLMADARFARIADLPSATLESGARRRVVRSRNELVRRYAFVDGVKTGHTLQAGYCLVGAVRGDGRPTLISVVLGEPSIAARDEDSLELLRYGLAQYRRRTVLDPRRAVAEVPVEYRDEGARLVPRTRVRLVLRRGERLVRRVRAPDELEGPMPKGARVGSVAVVRRGRVVRRVDLVTAAEVPGAGPIRVVTSRLGVPLTLLLALGILGAGSLLVLRARDKRRRGGRRRAGAETG
jgi:D-alanyl-D-alanine carboxypeptidase (penicillin-binding protein 5/6)